MPRGKGTVFAVFCAEEGSRIGTKRRPKQNAAKGTTWKDFQAKFHPYCPNCQKRVAVKMKEERHSK